MEFAQLGLAVRCNASADYAIMRCLYVCLHVCLSRSYIVSKQIKISSEIFSLSGSQAILVFRTKRHGNIPTGPPPLTGASNAGGVGRQRDSEPISGLTACCEAFQRQVQYT